VLVAPPPTDAEVSAGTILGIAGMLTVLGGLAEFERELIRARTSDGRARAKAKGVKFGRPSALSPDQRAEVLCRLANGEVQADVARAYGVSQATISRLA
jgi:DNA invertase Pin-like site-specific DNA recombinase